MTCTAPNDDMSSQLYLFTKELPRARNAVQREPKSASCIFLCRPGDKPWV